MSWGCFGTGLYHLVLWVWHSDLGMKLLSNKIDSKDCCNKFHIYIFSEQLNIFYFFSDIWAMDSGRLSLQLCEAKVAEHSKPDEIVEPCCACEEAKYEVTFEGLW